MADTALDILIRLKAELQGAKSAEEAIRNVNTAVAELLQAGRKQSEQDQEQSKTTEALTLKKHDLKKVVQELGREFPILGEAARLALNPQVTIALAAVTAFTLLKRRYDEAEETLRGGDWSSITGLLQDQDTAAHNAANSFQEYKDGLKRIADAQQTVKEKTDAALTSMRNQAKFAADLRAAQAALAKEQIAADKANGKVSPIDAEKKGAAIDKKKIDDDAAAELKAKQDELKLQQSAVAALKKEISDRESSIGKDESYKSEIEKRQRDLPSRISTDKTRLGVNDLGQALDKSGKVITQKNDGTMTGKRTGELGKLDLLQERFDSEQETINWAVEHAPEDIRADKRKRLTEAGTPYAVAKDAFDAQKKFTDNLFAVINQENKEVLQLKTDLKKINGKLTDKTGRNTADQAAAKELTDKTVPQLLEEIELLKKKIAMVVPIEKKSIDIHTDSTVRGIQKQDADDKAREKEAAAKKITAEYNRANPSRRSHGAGGGDFDDDFNEAPEGETVANTTQEAGRNISTAMQRRAASEQQTAKQIADAGQAIAKALAQSDEPVLQALKNISDAVQVGNKQLWQEIAQINSRTKNLRHN